MWLRTVTYSKNAEYFLEALNIMQRHASQKGKDVAGEKKEHLL